MPIGADPTAVPTAFADIDNTELYALNATAYGVPQTALGLLA